MPGTYRPTLVDRAARRLAVAAIRLGLGDRRLYLLTVRDQETGRLYSRPVTLIRHDGSRWLVSPFGEVRWIRDARAAGEVTLRRGRRPRTVSLDQVALPQAAAVLREYVRQVPLVRSAFEAGPDSPLKQFEDEAPRHPVFRLPF